MLIRYSLAWVVFLVVAAGPTKAQYFCEDCVPRYLEGCKTRCLSAKAQAPACERGCIVQKCGAQCADYPRPGAGAEGSAKAPEPTAWGKKEPGSAVEGRCAKCLREKKFEPCGEICRSREDQAVCRRSCALRRCVDQCEVTEREDGEFEPGSTPQPVRRGCNECRMAARVSCKTECGPEGRAGFIACTEGCVNSRCESECDPEQE